MKKIFNYILALMMSTGIFTACVDDINVGNAFLEKAPGVDVNIDTVFSKAEYARNFLWSAYGQLYCTYTRGNMMNGTPIDALSDSYHCYCGWGGPKQTYYTGGLTEDSQDNPNGNFQGKFAYKTGNPDDESNGDGRVSIYETIRKCWQIIENIEKVPDMTDSEKSRLRGEAYTIMASRYFNAFRNFGGLCLVKKAFAVGEGFEDLDLFGTFPMKTLASGRVVLHVLRLALYVPRSGCTLHRHCLITISLILHTTRNQQVWKMRSMFGLAKKTLHFGLVAFSIVMIFLPTMQPMATIISWYSQKLKTKPATVQPTAMPIAIVTMRHTMRKSLMFIPQYT